MLQFNLTLLLVLVSFLVFMVGMKNVFFDPVARMKILRDQKINLDRISLDELTQELNSLQKRIASQMIETKAKAQQMVLEAQQTAKAQAADRLYLLREQVTADREAYQDALHEEAEAVLAQLEQQIHTLSAQLLIALTEESPSHMRVNG